MIGPRHLRTISRGALVIAACALGACGATIGTLDLTGSQGEQDTTQSATPTNVASLTEVVQRNPNDAQAYNMRGSVLGRAQRNQEALADFDRAIALDANYTQAYANRGQVHRQTSKLELALADYNRRLRSIRIMRRPAWGAGSSTASAGARSTRSTISTAPSRSARTTDRPITIAGSFTRRRASTSSRSTISPHDRADPEPSRALRR